MAGIVFGMQVDAGGADVGVTQVVADHLEVGFLTQVAAGRVTHPVGGCLLQVGCRRFELGALPAQASRALSEDGELEGSVAELRAQRDLLLRDAADLRLRLERLPAAKATRSVGSPGIAKASRPRRKS